MRCRKEPQRKDRRWRGREQRREEGQGALCVGGRSTEFAFRYDSQLSGMSGESMASLTPRVCEDKG